METGGGFFGFGDYGEWSVTSAAASPATSWSLLPFGSAASSHSLTDTLFLSSPSSSSAGGMMGNNARAVFTMAQREELERQTLIFKYMVASIPVPPQLLLPLKPSIPIGSNRYSSSSSLDPEPWRCKRTDGKKWRCSRDVVPHQKYCERHSHKSRPRSRKPVEFLSSNPDSKLRMPSRDSTTVSSQVTGHESLSHLTPYHSQKEFSNAAGSATPRSLEWLMKGEVISQPQPHVDQLRWQHRPLSQFRPDHELQAQGGASGLMNDRCSLLLGMASLEGQGGSSKGSSALSKRVPTSSPSLAMFGEGGDGRRESIGRIGLGVGPSCVGGDGDCNRRAELKPHWMSPGGPLAEALCLGTTEQAMESCLHVINPDS